MCNACGNMCCGSDMFGGCGCDHCDNDECWDDEDDEFLSDDYGEPEAQPVATPDHSMTHPVTGTNKEPT